MKPRHYLGVIFLVLQTLKAPSTSDAYCYLDDLKDSNGNAPYHIPVYLVASNNSFLLHSATQVANHLRWAVQTWEETSATDFHPYFAGIVPLNTPYQAGAVYVRATTNCSQCGGSSACEDKDGVGGIFGQGAASQIFLEDTSVCGGGQWLLTGNGTNVYHHIFVHELGHSFGLDDEYASSDCAQNEGEVWESAMAQNDQCGAGRIVTRRDIDALRYKGYYGVRSRYYATRSSSDDGLSWTNSFADQYPVSGHTGIGSLGAATTTATEVFARPLFNAYWPYRTQSLVGSNSTPFSASVPWASDSSKSWDVGAGALVINTHHAIAYRPYEYHDRCWKGLVLSSYEASRGWVTREARNGSSTVWSPDDGVSVTFDHVTNAFIAAIAGGESLPDNTIKLQAWNATTGERMWFATTTYATKSYPTIACNTFTVAGTYNCMLAWQTTQSTPQVQYQRLRFNSTGISTQLWGTPKTAGYVADTAPALAAQPNSSYPFVLGIQQGEAYYTFRYRASDHVMTDERNVLWLPGTGFLNPSIAESNGRLRLRYMPL